MRVAHLIVFCGVFTVSNAFSAPVSQSPDKEGVLSNWSGLYGGFILGGQWGLNRNKTGDFGYNTDNDQWGYNESGLTMGGSLGYSYPWRKLVVGPEIELGYLSLRGDGAQPTSPGLDTVGKSSSDFYTALRARLGASFNTHQLFATGGVIGVNQTHQVVDSCNIAPCGGSMVDARKHGMVWGYTVGGGFEHLFEKNWSAKLECLYFNLNREGFSGVTTLGNRYEWTGQTAGYIIRGGLNYHMS